LGERAHGKGKVASSILAPGSKTIAEQSNLCYNTLMAKKGARELVALICSSCKSQNYITERNKVNMDTKGKGKLQINKFCKRCKKYTSHKETSKLK